MASLRNIMNVDDDHADSHPLKTPGQSSVPLSSQRPDPPASASSCANPADLSMTTTTSSSSSSSTTASSSASASAPSSSLREQRLIPSSYAPHATLAAETRSNTATPGRPQSNASTDSMDSPYSQSHGHASGHGRGNAGGSYSGSSMRPFVPAGDAPVKLTPVTRRPSRAKKGLAVHTCDECRPPKTFTRAEHLRRHKLSHQPPDLPCQVPGCDKIFHRKDLLERHQQRHDQEDKGAPRRSSSRSFGPGSPGQRNYGGSPSGNLLQLSQPFPSPTPGTPSTVGTSPRSMPISGAWQSTGNSTPHMQQEDFTMGGVKTEYPMESMTTLQSVSPRVTPGFSGPHSEPGLGIDPISGLCISDGSPPGASWQGGSGMVSSASGSSYSTPPSDVSQGNQPAFGDASTDWAGSLGQPSVPRSMQSPIMGTGNYPLHFGYPASPTQVYPTIYGEGPAVSLAGYDDGLYSSHMASTTVRGLSPQLAVGQSSETLVTTPSALPADRLINPLVCHLQPETALGLLTAQDLVPASPSREALSLIPAYLNPIIHRATFEDGSGVDAEHLQVLQCAMAAVATQFLSHREHRINGSQLHAYASYKCKTLTQSASWSLSIQQAVLLCEYYARFRGRSKEAYRPSPRFNTLCQMVATSQHTLETAGGGCDDSQRWKAWVHAESSRRLLAACFLLSVHGNWFYEQPFSAALGLDNFSPVMLSIPLSANTTRAWEAESAGAWAGVNVGAGRLRTVGDALQEMPTPAAVALMPSFDASLLLAAHALQLPWRQQHTEVDIVQDASCIKTDDMAIARLFPWSPGAFVYLALHYTPLHWLLSVSGDSWVFNKKIAEASSFVEQQRKLEAWRNSGSAAVATAFAARALKMFLRLEPGTPGRRQAALSGQPRALPWGDISGFWGVYVCALVCWAFGHGRRRSAGGASSRGAAARWILAVADLEPGQVQALAGREDSQGVAGLARDMLERDCLGGRSILYADAVGVLRRLDEVDNWACF